MYNVLFSEVGLKVTENVGVTDHGGRQSSSKGGLGNANGRCPEVSPFIDVDGIRQPNRSVTLIPESAPRLGARLVSAPQ